MQALTSNPLQAAAVGNVAVVSVAERYVEVRITELNASEPFYEVSLILVQVMSKVSVGQFWRQAMQ